jgi:hypothetical protein
MVYARIFFIIIGILTLIILYIKVYKEEKFWVLCLMTVTGLLYFNCIWMVDSNNRTERKVLFRIPKR